MSGLGTASGNLTIDASQAIRAVQSLAASLTALKGVNVDFEAIEKMGEAAQSAASQVKSASGVKFSVDTGSARDDLVAVGVAAEDAAGRVSGSRPVFFVDTRDSRDKINYISTIAESAASRINGAGATFSVNTVDAQDQLLSVGIAAEEAAAALSNMSGVSFSVNTGSALADITALRDAVSDLSSQLSAQGLTLKIDAAGAVGDLQTVESAIDRVKAAGDQAISMKIDVDASQTNDAISQLTQLHAFAGELYEAQITINTGALEDASAKLASIRSEVSAPMEANVQANTSALDEVEAKASRAKQAVEDIGSSAPQLNFGAALSQLQQMSTQLGSIQTMMSGLGNFALGGGIAALLVAPLVAGIKYAGQLEQSLKNVDVVLGGLGKSDLGRLKKEIIDIGTSTQFSAKEVADAAEQLGKAGYGVGDMIDGKMLPAVTALASATGESLQVAVTGIVQAMSQWSPAIADASIAMTDASRAADILTVAANSSLASVEDIIRGIRNLGPVAAQMGVSFAEAASAISIFTNYGMKGADAGVSLARGLQNLQKPSQEAKQLMQDLGIQIFDLQGKFIGLPEVFGQLSNALRDQSDEVRFNAISTLFGAEAMDAYSIAISQGADPLIEIVQLMQEQGVAMDQATARTQTFQGALERLGETTMTALGSASQVFVGPLTAIANGLTGAIALFTALPAPITSTIGAIAGIAGTALAASVALGGLATGARALLGLAQAAPGVMALVGALRSLATAAAGTRLGMAALALATNPIVLGLTAIAAVAGYVWLKHQQEIQKTKQAMEDLTKAQDQNDKSLQNAIDTGQTKVAGHMRDVLTMTRGAVAETQKMFADNISQFSSEALLTEDLDPSRVANQLVGFFDSTLGKAAIQWGTTRDNPISDELYQLVTSGSEDAFNRASPVLRGQALDLQEQYYEAFNISTADQTRIEESMQGIFSKIQGPDFDPNWVNETYGKLVDQYLTGPTPNVNGFIDALTAESTKLDTVAGQMEASQVRIEGAMDSITRKANDMKFSGDIAGAQKLLDVYKDYAKVMPQLSENNQGTFGDDLSRAFDLMNTGKVTDEFDRLMESYHRLFTGGMIDGEQYASLVHNLILNADKYATALDGQAEAQRRANAAAHETAAFLNNPDNVPELRTPKNVMDKINEIEDYNKTLQETVKVSAALDQQLAAKPGQERDLVAARQRIKAMQDERVTAEQLAAAKVLAAQSGDYSNYNDLAQKKLDQEAAQLAAMIALYEHFNALKNQDARSTAMGGHDPNKRSGELAQQIADQVEFAKTAYDKFKELAESQKQAYTDMFGAFAGYQGLDPSVMAAGMASFTGEAAKAGIAVQSAQSAFSNTYRIIVENTQGVSDLSSKTLEWADTLIAAEGTTGKIDDLLSRQLITQEEYTAAQKAYNSIAEDNAKIQDYTLQIQAKQAPLIARQQSALEESYRNVANMEGSTQLAALGWMDSAEAAKAMEINAMGAKVAAGEMGSAGKVGFENMLREAVKMDPALGAMLDQMGAIELAADGITIESINWDAMGEGQSEIQALIESINALTLALGGVPPLDFDTQQAKNKLDAFKASLKDMSDADISKMGQQLKDAFSGVEPTTQRAAASAKVLNDALVQLAQGKKVNLDTGNFGSQLQAAADKFREIKDAGDIEKKVRIDFDDQGNLDRLKQIAEQDGKTTTVHTKFDATGADDVKNAIDNLSQMSGRVIEVKTKFTTEGDAPDMSRYDAGGSGSGLPTVKIKTEYEPPSPTGFAPPAPAPVSIPTKWDALPPLDIPRPEPVIVPISFSAFSAGANAGSSVQSAAQAALGGGAGSDGITIAVKVSVAGMGQIDTLKSTLNGLNNKPVAVNVSVTGAELIGAIKLDVQNLSNKTVTITAAVTGAELIGALKLDIQNLSNKTVTVTLKADATSAGAAYSLFSTIPDITKTFFIKGDSSSAGAAYTAISTLPDVTKAFTMTGDSSEAGAAYTAISTLPDVSKAFTMTGDNSAAKGAYDELAGLADITKTMTINIVVNGSVPKLASGGYVKSALIRGGERGPEMFQTPWGTRGILPRDSLYSLPIGTQIFTASQTRRMMRNFGSGIPAFASGGTVGTPFKYTPGPQTAYERSVYRQLSVILKEIRDEGGDALKDSAKAVEDMMKDLSKATSSAISGVMNDLKDFGWPAPKTTALMNQAQQNQTQEANAKAGSAWERLDAIATEIEKYGGSSMESIAKAARDMQAGGPITQEAVEKMLKDLQDKGWAGTKTSALAKALKQTSRSLADASDLFSDETWTRRAQTVTNPNDVADLFADRVRKSDTDFTVSNGKYTEHYGGQKPPSGVAKADTDSNGQPIVVVQSLTPETYLDVLSGARGGTVAQKAIQKAQALSTARGITRPVSG